MGIMNSKELVADGYKPGKRLKPKCDTGEGLTKQEFAKEVDINYIVKRYAAVGEMPPSAFAPIQGAFADVSEIGDFAESLRRIDAAKEAFAALPADIRTRFDNEPYKLVEFLQDPANKAEAEKLFLVPKEPEAPVAPVAPVAAAPVPAK